VLCKAIWLDCNPEWTEIAFALFAWHKCASAAHERHSSTWQHRKRDAGNKWSLPALSDVILAGMACALLPVVLKLMVHDRHALGDESEAVTTRHVGSRASIAQSRNASRAQLARGSAGAGQKRADAAEVLAAEDGMAVASGATGALEGRLEGLRHAVKVAIGAQGSRNGTHNGHAENGSVTEPLLPGSGATNGNARTNRASNSAAQPNGAAARAERQLAAAPSGAQLTNGDASSHDGADGGQITSEGGELAEEEELDAASPLAFWVPLLVSLSDVTQGLAAGMTIKFFPIFFMDEARSLCWRFGASVPSFRGAQARDVRVSVDTRRAIR
jgi:hypothetical protein